MGEGRIVREVVYRSHFEEIRKAAFVNRLEYLASDAAKTINTNLIFHTYLLNNERPVSRLIRTLRYSTSPTSLPSSPGHMGMRLPQVVRETYAVSSVSTGKLVDLCSLVSSINTSASFAGSCRSGFLSFTTS